MFLKRPVFESNRNMRPRTMVSRNSANRNSTLLSKQFIGDSNNLESVAYVLEVQEENTNVLTTKVRVTQPWVVIKDRNKKGNLIRLPVTICNALLQRLLSCSKPIDQNSIHEVNNPVSASSPEVIECSPNATCAFGDGTNSDVSKTIDETQVNTKHTYATRIFNIEQLSPIRILCDTTGCTIEVLSRDPTNKNVESKDESVQDASTASLSKRWIVSNLPPTNRTNSLENEQSDDHHIDSNTSKHEDQKQLPEFRGFIEVYEKLLPQLSAFLADVVIRFRPTTKIPEVPPLYSVSGSRKFFFDLRDTRWGCRLQISQLTNFHRNTVGIPLETLVNFRSRLDKIIENLQLDDHYSLKSTLGAEVEDKQLRGQMVTNPSKHEINENDEKHDNIDKKPTSVNRNYRKQNYRPQLSTLTRNVSDNTYQPRRNKVDRLDYLYYKQAGLPQKGRFINNSSYHHHRSGFRLKPQKTTIDSQNSEIQSVTKTNNAVSVHETHS